MIFISHSSKDQDAAAALHARLLARDYDPSQIFLDSDVDSGFAAGELWQQVLYARLKDCRALIVLCTQNWLDSKWCFAELIYAKASGKEIFPVVLEECDFRGVLDQHQAVMVHRDGDAAYERLWRALDTRHLGPRDDFGWPPKGGDGCPFPGLLSFDERYAGVYFGREPETQAVLEELRKMRANGEPRLLMITGGSGSGKSSLLKAGVLPQLTHKSSGTEWLVLPVLRYGQAASPQHTVFDQLAMNVAPSDWKTLRDTLAGPEAAKAFVDATRDLAVARGSPEATVLLPIDQFEELLAPAAGSDANAFLRFLHEVFACANGRLLAIGTLRSDHLDVYERHPHALTTPYFQPWRLGPFPRERVRDVIVKPAARAGVEVTPDLLARLERDTPTSESLPLLAFTLEKLYRRYAADRKLELQEYEDLGGMEGAIQKSADAIALAPDALEAVRLMFVKHLASVNDKDEVVRVTARWSDVPEAAKPALEKFVDDRLLVRNAGSLEVAHEALFRAWPALKMWLHGAADILRWRRDVQRDRADPKWSGLRPAQLAVARPWLRHRRSELTDEEVRWIRKGIRRERMQRAAVAAVAVIVLAFGVYAWIQKRAADRESQVALGRFLASQSVEVAANTPLNSGLALLLAIEGYRRAPSAVTALPLRSAMAVTPLPIARLRHGGEVSVVAFSPDGRLLATGEKTGRVRVWDVAARTQLATMALDRRVTNVFWRPGSERLVAVASARRELVFWDWRAKRVLDRTDLPEQSQMIPADHPDRWLLQLNAGNLMRWGSESAPLSVTTGLQPSVPAAATRSGGHLATTVVDHAWRLHRLRPLGWRLYLLDTTTGRAIAAPLVIRDGPLSAVAFRPDGRAVAVATTRGTTRVWDWQRNVVETTYKGVVPQEIVFSPDGKLVAQIGAQFGTSLRVWDVLTGRDIFSLDSKWGVGSQFTWTRFSDDGRHLIACLGDSAVRVFYVSPEQTVLPVLRFTSEATVLDMDVDRTGKLAAVGSGDGWATVWSLEPGHSARHFSGAAGPISSSDGSVVALFGPHSRVVDVGSGKTLLPLGSVQRNSVAVFSRNGQQLAWTLDDDRVAMADLQMRTTRLLPKRDTTAMRFSPDGTRLLIADRDGGLTSVANGRQNPVLQTHGDLSSLFSPDARFFAEFPDRRVYLYDVIGKKKLAEIASVAYSSNLAFSPDGKLLALNPDHMRLAIWSTESGAEWYRFPVANTVTPNAVFDPSSRHVAVANGTKIEVHDIVRKKRASTLLQTGGEIQNVAFSPDGEYLAAGSADKNVRIWRMADGAEIMAIPQEHSFLFNERTGDGGTVAFTSDGKYLMVAQGSDKGPYGRFVRLILWRPEDVLREACRRSFRKKLTEAEWQQFLPGQPYRETCGDGAVRGW